MTDKERLEEIKEAYRWTIDNSLVPRLSDSDIEWLIEQSGKVEELELEINAWRNAWQEEVQKRQRFYKESEESHLETKELIKSIVNQNKRQAEKVEYWMEQHRKRCNELEDAYFKIQLIENQLHQAQAKAERYREALEFYEDWFRN